MRVIPLSQNHLAFASAAPLSPTRTCTLLSSVTVYPRRPAPATVRYAVRRSPAITMSLVNDLLVKGLEVSVATFLGNAVAVQQAAKPAKESTGLFGSRKRKPRRPANPVQPADASRVVSELMRMAQGLPAVVERGGPEGKKWVKLAICLAIDLVGSGSLGVPFLGDALDVVTAPISAVMLQALFGSSLVTIAGFAEEILPGTDGIPTATLAWLAEEYGYLQVDKGRDTNSG